MVSFFYLSLIDSAISFLIVRVCLNIYIYICVCVCVWFALHTIYLMGKKTSWSIEDFTLILNNIKLY